MSATSSNASRLPHDRDCGAEQTGDRLNRRRLLAAICWLPMVAGCAQMAVVGRIFYGDPKQESAFKGVTGKNLKKAKSVALFCTATDTIASEYDMVAIDVQEELVRMMRKNDIKVVDADEVSEAIDANGGLFDIQAIARDVDADYLFHVDIELFSHIAPNSPQLYHGRAMGYVYGYEIRGGDDDEATARHAVRLFERAFDSEYPGKHPVPADRTPERVFRNRFVSSLSNDLGRMFYDFRTNETF